MLAKWITCDVPADARDALSAAQRRWSVIADQPGLVGQVGGWDTRTGRAHVLALWADADSHRVFMRDRHDAVAEPGLTGITVALGDVVLTMPGTTVAITTTAMGEAMDGSLLRVADCHVAADAEEHFLDVQREVWAPAMAGAGVLGGVVARLAADRYLVATFWPDAETHLRYVREVPRLRARAVADADIASSTGHVLALEPTWRVRRRADRGA